MKIIFVGLVLIFLSGCATTPKCEPTIQIKEVPKLIYKNPPKAAEVDRPPLPIDNLKEGDSPEQVAKAYVASVELLRDYAKRLEIVLEPYQNVDEN